MRNERQSLTSYSRAYIYGGPSGFAARLKTSLTRSCFTFQRLAELAQLIRSRQFVLVFTNVRSAAEQIGLKLKQLVPDLASQIEIHASLDRSVRLEVEDRLKN